MIRAISWLVGFWLALLFIVGQGAHVPQWIVWLDGLASVFAILGGAIANMVSGWARIAGPVALSLGLFALWIGGLVVRAPLWLPWCNFMAAVVYLGVTLAAATFPEKRDIPRRATPTHP
jgi:hypothetical protein